jgi:hypothetical protein
LPPFRYDHGMLEQLGLAEAGLAVPRDRDSRDDEGQGLRCHGRGVPTPLGFELAAGDGENPAGGGVTAAV